MIRSAFYPGIFQHIVAQQTQNAGELLLCEKGNMEERACQLALYMS